MAAMLLALCAAVVALHARSVSAQIAPIGPIAASPGPTGAPGAATPAPSPAAPTPAPTTTPAPTAVPVSVDKDGFHPSTVRVYSGQEVSWTNNDAKTNHTATAADGSWDTGQIDPGHSQTRQFFEPGKWDYIDGFNPLLRAVLIVLPGPAPSASP